MSANVDTQRHDSVSGHTQISEERTGFISDNGVLSQLPAVRCRDAAPAALAPSFRATMLCSGLRLSPACVTVLA